VRNGRTGCKPLQSVAAAAMAESLTGGFVSDPTNSQDLKMLDEADVSALHWKIMLVSGMGFFTDASAIDAGCCV
jgi:hypothetical protein